jgi:hypothetical protein
MIVTDQIYPIFKIINNYSNKQKLCLERVTQHDYFAHQHNETNKGTKQ